MKKVLILLAIAYFIVIGIFMFDKSREIKLKNDFESKLNLREEIIEKIKNNEIEVDENGNAVITEEYYGISDNDYVHIFVCNNEETVIAFLYKSGFPDESQYIVYSSSDDKLIKKYVDKSLYSYIEKIENNWYFVQYN